MKYSIKKLGQSLDQDVKYTESPVVFKEKSKI